MNSILFMTKGGSHHNVYVPETATMDFMSFLEGSDNVDRYKIISGTCGTLTENNLNYLYCGFVYPAGKLVEFLHKNDD